MTLGLIMLWDDVTPSMTCTPQLPSFEGKRQGCSVLQVDWRNMNWQYLLRLWPLELTPHVSCNARVVRRVAQQRVDQSRLTWRCLPLPVVSCCLARNWQGMANIFEYLCKLFEADYKASGSKHNKNLNLGPFVAGAGKSCHSTRDDQDSSMSNKATSTTQKELQRCYEMLQVYQD